jgi:hypothetical protein
MQFIGLETCIKGQRIDDGKGEGKQHPPQAKLSGGKEGYLDDLWPGCGNRPARYGQWCAALT